MAGGTKAGEVYIDVRAEFAKFSSDMTQLGKTVTEQASGMKSAIEGIQTSFNALNSVLGVFGAALSVGALVEFSKRALEDAAAIKTLSAQIGVSTNDLQVWQFAARDAGVNVDQMTSGMEHFARQVGAVADGNKEAVQSFNRLGVGILDVHGKQRSLDALMVDAARHIAALKNPVDQARAAFELYGRVGQAMIPALKEMGQHEDETREKAEQFNSVLSDETIKAADDAQNSINRLSKEFEDLYTVIMAKAGPAMDYFAGVVQRDIAAIQASTITSTGEPWWKELIPDVRQFDWRGFLGLAEPEMPQRAAARPDTPRGMGQSFATDTLDLGGTRNPPPAGGGTDAAARQAKAQADAIKRVTEQLEFENAQLGLSNEAQRTNALLRQAGTTIETQQGQRILELNHHLMEEQARMAENNRLDQEAAQIKEAILTPQQKYIEQLDELNKLLATGKLNYQQYTAAMKQAMDQMNEADPAYQRAIEEQKTMQDEVNQLADDVGSQLADAFLSSASAADKWKSLATIAIKDVMNIMEQLLNKALGNDQGAGLAGIFGTLLSGIFTGGGSGIVGGAAVPIPTTPIAHLASGGNLGVGDWAIVGEKGPELVYADTPGNVLSAARTRGIFGSGAAGSPIAINIDGRGADMAAVARIEVAVRALHQTFDARAVTAVAAQRQRGGTFATTFRR